MDDGSCSWDRDSKAARRVGRAAQSGCAVCKEQPRGPGSKDFTLRRTARSMADRPPGPASHNVAGRLPRAAGVSAMRQFRPLSRARMTPVQSPLLSSGTGSRSGRAVHRAPPLLQRIVHSVCIAAVFTLGAAAQAAPTVELQVHAGSAALGMNRLGVAGDARGRALSITRLDLLLSGLSLQRADGSWTADAQWHGFFRAGQANHRQALADADARALPRGAIQRRRRAGGQPRRPEPARPRRPAASAGQRPALGLAGRLRLHGARRPLAVRQGAARDQRRLQLPPGGRRQPRAGGAAPADRDPARQPAAPAAGRAAAARRHRHPARRRIDALARRGRTGARAEGRAAPRVQRAGAGRRPYWRRRPMRRAGPAARRWRARGPTR